MLLITMGGRPSDGPVTLGDFTCTCSLSGSWRRRWCRSIYGTQVREAFRADGSARCAASRLRMPAIPGARVATVDGDVLFDDVSSATCRRGRCCKRSASMPLGFDDGAVDRADRAMSTAEPDPGVHRRSQAGCGGRMTHYAAAADYRSQLGWCAGQLPLRRHMPRQWPSPSRAPRGRRSRGGDGAL